MKFNKEELKEIVECIDFVTNQLRFFNTVYVGSDRGNKYKRGYLNYLITLRNGIIEELNKVKESK